MTAQTMDGAMTAISAVAAAVSGVQASPAYPIFNINDRVFVLNWIMSGVCEISETGTKQWLLTIGSDLLTPLIDVVNEDIQTIVQLADSISTAYIREASSGGDMFGNAIDTFNFCRIEPMAVVNYNNITHTGYRIILEEVKLKLDL